MLRNPVLDHLQRIFDECGADLSGAVADYIPELAEADPARFGLCVATVDGHVYELGDTRATFSMQSISKPFTYGLALADRGRDAIAQKIDVEPSGEAFNLISVSPVTSRPSNPMINSGAITAASLVAGSTPVERSTRILASYSAFAGRQLVVDEAVLASERASGHRNRAIGHMLREFDIITEDPDEMVDQYLRQCSATVDCHDLSVMAATLANGGLHPHTGERALSSPLVEQVLSVMTTCGMYDDAGDWVATVGLPAKSGVSGGIIAVLPGQLGIAVFSPRIDRHGNSVRGVQTCRRLSNDLELHFMHVSRNARSAVRNSYDIRTSPSRRRRSDSEREVLEAYGDRALVYELHGDLLFAGAESIARAVTGQDQRIESVILDLRRVDDVADVARTVLVELRQSLQEGGREVVFVDPDQILFASSDTASPEVRPFRTRDAAVEWCEDRLIERHGVRASRARHLTLIEHPLMDDMDPETMRIVASMLAPRSCEDGELIVAAGSPAAGAHLILSGQVALRLRLPEGGRRISTLSAGMSFGEYALVLRRDHQFDITAEGQVELMVLTAQALEDLDRDHPRAAIVLWQALARDAYSSLAQALREVAAQADYGS